MAILLFVHLARHSSTASEQLSCISLVREIGTLGLMSGDGQRSVAAWSKQPHCRFRKLDSGVSMVGTHSARLVTMKTSFVFSSCEPRFRPAGRPGDSATSARAYSPPSAPAPRLLVPATPPNCQSVPIASRLQR